MPVSNPNSVVSGTANEITASASGINFTVSLPAALTFTGKTVTGGTFNSTFNGSIGGTTPAAGVFTSLTSAGTTTTTMVGAGGTGTTPAYININGGSGIAGGSAVLLKENGANLWGIGIHSSVLGSGNSDDCILYSYSAGKGPRIFYATGNLALPASGYLNFGTTDGTSGYGFHDNAGAIQFKDSGGTWTTLSSVVSPGADDINFDYGVTGSSVITVGDSLRERISVTQFGAIGDNSTGNRATNNAAFANALTYLGTTRAGRVGGLLYVPHGAYQLSATLTMPSNTIIEGEGYDSVLDFGAISGSGHTGPGINLSSCNNAGLRNIYISSANGDGVYATNTGANPSSLTFSNVTSRFNGGNGFYLDDAYLCHFTQVVASNNTDAGIKCVGFHTSLKFDQCSGSDNGTDAFYVDNAIYSMFDNCTADDNGDYAYNIRNCHSISFTSCGAERNLDGMFLFQGIVGGSSFENSCQATINACFGIDNGGATSFIEAAAGVALTIDLILLGACWDEGSGGASIITTGTVKLYDMWSRLSGTTTVNSPGWLVKPPTSKPTVIGSRGGNAALASLLTALASYGFITDSSS